jgi:hypothetical protein
MGYIRHDANNNPVSPQPGITTVTVFADNEGWTTLSYDDWNSDYVKRDVDNNIVTPQPYQRHDINNNPVGVGTYQRYDENCDPIYA